MRKEGGPLSQAAVCNYGHSPSSWPIVCCKLERVRPRRECYAMYRARFLVDHQLQVSSQAVQGRGYMFLRHRRVVKRNSSQELRYPDGFDRFDSSLATMLVQRWIREILDERGAVDGFNT